MKIYYFFVDVHKDFDTNPRSRFTRRPQDIGMPNEMQWWIYPLYESVIVNIWAHRRMSNSANNNIELKDDQSSRSRRN